MTIDQWAQWQLPEKNCTQNCLNLHVKQDFTETCSAYFEGFANARGGTCGITLLGRCMCGVVIDKCTLGIVFCLWQRLSAPSFVFLLHAKHDEGKKAIRTAGVINQSAYSLLLSQYRQS
jgi:hypothetical protein